jgi:hypothetical protein
VNLNHRLGLPQLCRETDHEPYRRDRKVQGDPGVGKDEPHAVVSDGPGQKLPDRGRKNVQGRSHGFVVSLSRAWARP